MSTLKAQQGLGFTTHPLERSVVDSWLWVWLSTYPGSPIRSPHGLETALISV